MVKSYSRALKSGQHPLTVTTPLRHLWTILSDDQMMNDLEGMHSVFRTRTKEEQRV